MTERRTYLDEVVAELWPGGRLEPRNGQHVAGDTEFVALPNRANPVLLVPAGPPAATAAALRGAKTGAASGQRRALRLGAQAARLGLLSLSPTRLVVARQSAEQTLVDWLATRLGQPLVASIPSTPVRANRKPILHLIGPQGETVGYAKVGINDLTRRLVVAEAAALAAVAEAPVSGVRVPRVLFSGSWRNCEVLVQEPLVPRGPQAWDQAQLDRRIHDFATAAGTTSAAVADSPYVAGLGARVRALPSSDGAGRLAAALDGLVADDPGVRLEHGRWHGDWTPWNMARSGDTLLLWDLERSQGGVPVGFDQLHFRLQRAVVRQKTAARDAAPAMIHGAASTLAAYGIDAETARVTAQLYLLEIGARYCADDQRTVGAAMSRLEDWLLPALESATVPAGG